MDVAEPTKSKVNPIILKYAAQAAITIALIKTNIAKNIINILI